MREPGSGTRAVFETAMAGIGVKPEALRYLLELPCNESVMAAVAHGGALAAVSDLAAAPHLAAGTLQPVPFDLPARAFSLLAHRERPPSKAVAAFLDCLPA